ncbi:MAG: lipid-A-disaccharide synthase [Breznakibacter sp.]
MKYYIVAGEPSGDLHGSNLMRELKTLDANADFRFFGGDLMAAQGGTLVKHYRELAFMGVFEVVMNFRTIKRNMAQCQRDLMAYRPDVLILIDYPGFNLRIAEFAKKNGVKVFYYISPKLWAWNTGRVKKIKKYVDRLFTILPFETQFYARYGIEVDYSGNPVLDAIDARPNKHEDMAVFKLRNGLDHRPIVAVLAGSRKQELSWVLPDMLKMIPKFPGYQFVIAGAPSFSMADYRAYIDGYDIKVLFDQTYQLVQHARAAMVTSGTATLETALLNCPQVVCYRMWGGNFSDYIAKRFIIKVRFISLVNLILDREGVRELFQKNFTVGALEHELGALLENDGRRKQIFADYEELHRLMGQPGSSRKTAGLMWKRLEDGRK